MIVTYIKAATQEEILALRAFVRNVSDPQQGRAAVEEHVDEDGVTIPAQPAVGDPAFWYSSVLASFPLPLFGGLQAADKETVITLCGGWAGHDA